MIRPRLAGFEVTGDSHAECASQGLKYLHFSTAVKVAFVIGVAASEGTNVGEMINLAPASF